MELTGGCGEQHSHHCPSSSRSRQKGQQGSERTEVNAHAAKTNKGVKSTRWKRSKDGHYPGGRALSPAASEAASTAIGSSFTSTWEAKDAPPWARAGGMQGVPASTASVGGAARHAS